MEMITIRCNNQECPRYSEQSVTIPAGRTVAPGVTEVLGTLRCDSCSHDMWKDPA